jgi:hypothetical protein
MKLTTAQRRRMTPTKSADGKDRIQEDQVEKPIFCC